MYHVTRHPLNIEFCCNGVLLCPVFNKIAFLFPAVLKEVKTSIVIGIVYRK
jgi:hypothetical protein